MTSNWFCLPFLTSSPCASLYSHRGGTGNATYKNIHRGCHVSPNRTFPTHHRCPSVPLSHHGHLSKPHLVPLISSKGQSKSWETLIRQLEARITSIVAVVQATWVIWHGLCSSSGCCTVRSEQTVLKSCLHLTNITSSWMPHYLWSNCMC